MSTGPGRPHCFCPDKTTYCSWHYYEETKSQSDLDVESFQKKKKRGRGSRELVWFHTHCSFEINPSWSRPYLLHGTQENIQCSKPRSRTRLIAYYNMLSCRSSTMQNILKIPSHIPGENICPWMYTFVAVRKTTCSLYSW